MIMINRITGACAIMGASLSLFPAGRLDDTKAIQGLWAPVTAVLAGQPMEESIVKIISLNMDNGKYLVLVGDAPDKGTYTLHQDTKPKGIDVAGTEGPNAGKTFPAIYELKGDTLRICYDLSGARRPAEFKSIAGTKLYLVTYIRHKK